MITEQDLREAIAECEGTPKPTANTYIKLAAFYTIRDHLYPKVEKQKSLELPVAYSGAAAPESKGITYDSGSEFSDVIHGLDPDRVFPVIDELMDTLSVINPRLYNGVMRRFTE